MEVDALNYIWGKGYDVVAIIDPDNFQEYKKKYGPFNSNNDVLLGFREKQTKPTNISLYVSSLGAYYEIIWHCKYIKCMTPFEKERFKANERLINIAGYETWTYTLTKPYSNNVTSTNSYPYYTNWYKKRYGTNYSTNYSTYNNDIYGEA